MSYVKHCQSFIIGASDGWVFRITFITWQNYKNWKRNWRWDNVKKHYTHSTILGFVQQLNTNSKPEVVQSYDWDTVENSISSVLLLHIWHNSDKKNTQDKIVKASPTNCFILFTYFPVLVQSTTVRASKPLIFLSLYLHLLWWLCYKTGSDDSHL